MYRKTHAQSPRVDGILQTLMKMSHGLLLDATVPGFSCMLKTRAPLCDVMFRFEVNELQLKSKVYIHLAESAKC